MNSRTTSVDAATTNSVARVRRRSILILFVSCVVLIVCLSLEGLSAVTVALGALAGSIAMALVILKEHYKSLWPLALLGLAGVVPLAMSPIPFEQRDVVFYAQYFAAVFLAASAVTLLLTVFRPTRYEA